MQLALIASLVAIASSEMNVKEKIADELYPRILEVVGEVLIEGMPVVENIKQDADICGNFGLPLDQRIAKLENLFYQTSEVKDKERAHADAVRNCLWFQEKHDTIKAMGVDSPLLLKQAMTLSFSEDLLMSIRNATRDHVMSIVEKISTKKEAV